MEDLEINRSRQVSRNRWEIKRVKQACQIF